MQNHIFEAASITNTISTKTW